MARPQVLVVVELVSPLTCINGPWYVVVDEQDGRRISSWDPESRMWAGGAVASESILEEVGGSGGLGVGWVDGDPSPKLQNGGGG